ncbi:hypothetical protein Y032_0017g3260 [Ancylostoma ceylanicum]|uniref:SCP domain-containing protein n=1 Tax=Ancylostoma ceylanicum TaxID=53326 RepID=A0A016V6B5_9BILA|nr:hypothetical protein Y032_0017g3260 [Ancylostoma ceylanicum]
MTVPNFYPFDIEYSNIECLQYTVRSTHNKIVIVDVDPIAFTLQGKILDRRTSQNICEVHKNKGSILRITSNVQHFPRPQSNTFLFQEWDFDMEAEAKAFICDPTLPSVDFGVTYDSIDLDGSTSIISTRTRAILHKWWNQAKRIDLSSDPIYVREKIREFGIMALAKNTHLACAYGSCANGGKLLCMYDQMPMSSHALYQKATVPAEICTACSVSTQCVNSLCSSRKPDGSITGSFIASSYENIKRTSATICTNRSSG